MCRSPPIQNSSPFGLWLAQFWTRPNPNTIYYFCANEYLITQSLKGSVSTVSYYKRVVSRQAMQVFARKVHIHSIHSHTLFRKIDLRFYSICWSIEVIAHIWFHQGQENNINITQFTRIHTQGAQLFTSYFGRSLLRNKLSFFFFQVVSALMEHFLKGNAINGLISLLKREYLYLLLFFSFGFTEQLAPTK